MAKENQEQAIRKDERAKVVAEIVAKLTGANLPAHHQELWG